VSTDQAELVVARRRIAELEKELEIHRRARVEVVIEPFRGIRDLIATIPGISFGVADVIIAETGADLSRFPSAEQSASWAGTCPGNNESAGRVKSTRPRRGGPSLTDALLAGFCVGRRAGGVNAHTGAGHEHRLMAIVPAHHVRRRTARALDLEHLTTTGRITDVQAVHRDSITDRCLHRRPPRRPTPWVCVTPSSSLSPARSRGPGLPVLRHEVAVLRRTNPRRPMDQAD
jgi:Transposase IS116/IS110/IS902 family